MLMTSTTIFKISRKSNDNNRFILDLKIAFIGYIIDDVCF